MRRRRLQRNRLLRRLHLPQRLRRRQRRQRLTAYCRQRGMALEDAVSMIVNGFCKQVFRELPMEFAVEAQKLLGVSLEGSVG